MTTARATSRAVTFPPAMIRISAGRPVVTALVKPAGITIATPARSASTSAVAAATSGAGLTSAMPVSVNWARTSSRNRPATWPAS